MSLGTRIQKLLTAQGITQRELAEHLHLSANTVNGYIRNRRCPDCSTLSKIAMYLNTSVDYLLGNTSVHFHPEYSLTPDEGLLLSNYRAINAERRHLLLEISTSLYANNTEACPLFDDEIRK